MISKQLERGRNTHPKVSKWSRKESSQKEHHSDVLRERSSTLCNVMEKPMNRLTGKLPVGNLSDKTFTAAYSSQADLLEEAMFLRKIENQGITNVVPATQVEASLLKEFRLMNDEQFVSYTRGENELSMTFDKYKQDQTV